MFFPIIFAESSKACLKVHFRGLYCTYVVIHIHKQRISCKADLQNLYLITRSTFSVFSVFHTFIVHIYPASDVQALVARQRRLVSIIQIASFFRTMRTLLPFFLKYVSKSPLDAKSENYKNLKKWMWISPGVGRVGKSAGFSGENQIFS